MSERSTLRLVVLQVLVISLFVTLLGRLFYLQVLSGETYKQAASDNRVREVITPAVRGLILDQAGRPMVANRTSLVVSVDRTAVLRQKDKGKAVLTRLAAALGTTPQDLSDRLQLCGTKEAKKPPICWNGSPYQPIPVAKDVPTALALRIMEQRVDFPGVKAELEAVREYPTPYGTNAAHLLGYLGPVTDAELQASRGDALESGATELRRTDLVGRAGLESTYDSELRGEPGVKQLSVDRAGAVTGTVGETDATPGNYLVTNIDARLQSVVEAQLLAAITRARGQGKVGDSGSAVVVDVTNGHVLAMASWPTYDPSVWVGGIGRAEYAKLTSTTSGTPLLARAVQGQYVPASTFKVVSAAAAAGNGFPLDTVYKCPNETKIGNRVVRNNESKAYGDVTLSRAIEVSCNTVFAALGYDMWLSDGGNTPTSPRDAIEKMAGAFGYGKRTGVDLPSESRGRVGGRAFKQAYYDQYKDAWCKRKDTGYPEVARTDPARAAYLKALAAENCLDGNKYRGGDAANLAIGQGDTVVTPLQVAMVYAAIANGGVLWQPQVAKAVVSSSGKVVQAVKPKVNGRLPVSRETLRYLQASLRGVVTDGTAAGVFRGFPVALAAKTGSGQVQDKDPTTWMASYGPNEKPRYAVVMTVNQGQTGAETVGPSLRAIWAALMGVSGNTASPTRSVLVGGAPQAKLPVVRPDGTVVYPELRRGIPKTAAAAVATVPPAAAAAAARPSPSGSSP